MHHILRATASGRPRPDVGGPSRATARHAPSIGPSDRPADRASSACGLQGGSSKPSPPATPSLCRIACGRLRDALIRSVRGQGCLQRSAVWSGKPWDPPTELVSAIASSPIPASAASRICARLSVARRVVAPAQHRRVARAAPRSTLPHPVPYVHHWSPAVVPTIYRYKPARLSSLNGIDLKFWHWRPGC